MYLFDIFLRNPKTSNFMKTHPVGARIIPHGPTHRQTDRQMNRQTDRQTLWSK